MSTVSLIIDQGPVYDWIKQNCFDGEDVWIYNCAAYWGKTNVRFVCRARTVNNAGMVSNVVTWTTSMDYVLLTAPIVVNIEPLSKSTVDDVGPQDARVFTIGDNTDWIIFNMLSFNGSRQMCLGNLNGNTRIPLTIVNHKQRHIEKNWTPFVWRGVLHFIYSFDPLVIICCPDPLIGWCHVVYGDASASSGVIGPYRGGTPAIETSAHIFEGFMHSTTRLEHSQIKYSKDELPIPANKTSVVYQTHKFTLNLQLEQPRLMIGPPISVFGKQIELVYGWNGTNDFIVNVNDKASVLVKV